jgi:DNA-3-methyladenine glycosylase II
MPVIVRPLESSEVEDRLAALERARRYLARRDPVLKQVIVSVGACSLLPAQNRFHALVRSIISQQISTRAAAAIATRLETTLARSGISPRALERLSVEKLRGVGLSAAKIQSLLDLAVRVRNGSVPLHNLDDLADEDVIEKLTPVRGIGRWTAEMFLIFSLGRLDVFPIADLGLRAGVRKHYGLDELPDKAYLFRLGESWRPYRSIGTWYIWRSLKAEPQVK